MATYPASPAYVPALVHFLFKAAKNKPRSMASMFDEADFGGDSGMIPGGKHGASNTHPHAPKMAEAAKVRSLLSLFDETLHPRAGSGNTVVNPETGQIITGGQFAPTYHAKVEPAKEKEATSDGDTERGGGGVSPESEGESPRPVHHFANKRDARRRGTVAADALRGQGSLFDSGDGDAPAGSAGGSGAGLPAGAGPVASAGPAGDEPLGTGTQGTDDTGLNPAGVVGAALAADEERERLGIDVDTLSGAPESSVADGVHTISAPMKDGYDYRITDEDAVGKGGFRVKLNDNMEALRILKTLDAQERVATPQEQARLVKYTGWGWAQALFNMRNALPSGAYYREYTALQDLLTPEEFAAARGSTLNAYYTAPAVIRAIWDGVKRLGFDGGRVLEPSSGIGHFFGLMPADMAARSSLAAVELDPLTARICGHLYQNANVKNCGFEETSYAGADAGKRKNVLPDEFFDLAVSNVPFGNYGVSDPQFDSTAKGYLTRTIHNYFFAQAMNKVRPGGLIAFVTSTGTLDAPGAERVREYLSQHADMVGAYRLPSDSFEENAGTSVTTDVIFLRKRMPGEAPSGKEWTKTVPFDMPDGSTVLTNEYHAANQADSLLGTPVANEIYRPGGADTDNVRMALKGTGEPVDEVIARATESLLPQNVYTPRGSGTEATEPAKQYEFVPPPDHVKLGGYGLVDDELMRRDGNGMVPCVFARDAEGKPVLDGNGNPVRSINQSAEARIRGMIGIRDKVRELHRAMLDPSVEDDALQPRQFALRLAYAGFVRKHGNLHNTANMRAFASDPDLALLLSLENYDSDTKTATPSDIFEKRTMRPVTPPTTAGTPHEALLHSLNQRGYLDFAYMAKLTGKTKQELQQHLIASGHVFRNPNGDFEERASYLAGNVREKLRQAEAAAAHDPQFLKNVEELRAVQPVNLSPADIDVHLGAGYVPPDMVKQFACHLLGIPAHDTSSMPSVDYLPAIAQWTVGRVGSAYNTNAAARQTYGTDQVSALELLHMGLNGQRPTLYKDDPSGEKDDKGRIKRIKDVEATEKACDKLETIRSKWENWVFATPERQDELCGIYNETYNCDVDRHYDGSHLDLPGMSEACRSNLNDHVKSAVWRQLQCPTTLLAHAVGAGKTWSCACAAIEMRRMGMATKPMVVVPNHLVGQWRKDIQEVYPGAKVLMATKKDFATDKRREFLSKVQNGDWDMVVIGHSSFGRIPVSPEREKKHYDEQIGILEDFLRQSKSEDAGGGTGGGKRGKSPATKQIEKSLKAYKVKLEKAMAKREVNTDDFQNFEDLGVDRLFVDEAHLFKNLEAPTKRTRVKGLPNGGSQRALDMFLKCEHIQEHSGGRGGVTFATGTPVANSLAELYTMQRYLDNGELKRRGLGHLDAWINNFGKTKRDLEATATGEMRMTERMSQFTNLPELSHLFRRFADVILSDQLNIARPDVERVAVGCAMSEHQEKYIKNLARRAEAITGPASHRPDPSEDNMLKITSDGRKNSLDQRLIDPNLPDDENSKINMLVQKVMGEYHDSHGIRGTQAVFMDMGTPKATDGDEEEEEEEGDEQLDPVALRDKRARKFIGSKKAGVLRDYAQAAHDHLAAMYRLTDAQADGNVAPTELVDAALAAHARFQDAATAVYEGKPQTRKSAKAIYAKLDSIHSGGSESEEERGMRNSLYAQVKAKLVAQGMPENEIAFIHDADTEARKLQLFKDVNSGKVRVLLGSTEKMGTGMNVQQRMVALHHMDCPWRPADLEQREGRIIRKGNINKSVRLYNYITQGTDSTASFDTYLWQLIRTKQGTIDQVMRADPNVRRAEDIGDAVLHASQMIAIGYNNPLMHERNELLGQVARLSRQKSAHMGEQYTARTRLKSLPTEIADQEKHLGRVALAQTHRDSNTVKIGDKTQDRVSVGGKVYDNPEEGIGAMLGEAQTIGNDSGKVVGTVNGFQVHARRPAPDALGPKPVLFTLSADHDAYRRGEAWGGHAEQSDSVRGQLQRFRNVLGGIDGERTARERTLAATQKSKSDFEGNISEFPGEAELTRLQDRMREVDKALGTHKDDVAATLPGGEDEDGEDLSKAIHGLSGNLSRVGGKWSDRSFGANWHRHSVGGALDLAASGVRGIGKVLKQVGGQYHSGSRLTGADKVGAGTTVHDLSVPSSGAASVHLTDHLRANGYDVVDVRRGRDEHIHSAGTGTDAPRTDTLTSHKVLAVHRASGDTHSFVLKSRPWLGEGHTVSSAIRHLSGAPETTTVMAPAASPVHAPLSSSSLPSPLASGGSGSAGSVGAAPAFAQTLADKFKMAVAEHREEASPDGTPHHAVLLTHSRPSQAIDRLYKHLEASGHSLSPISYSRANVDGLRKHVYKFTTQGQDGRYYSFHVARPRHENSGAVPKVYETRRKNAAGSHFRNKKSA